MASLIGQIGDAVVSDLNAGSFSQAFMAVRKWLVDWTLEELATLRVAVTVGPASWEILGRARDDQRQATDVIVQKRIDPFDNSASDSLIELVEELVGHFRGRRLTAGTQGIVCLERTLVGGGQAPIDRELLDNPHVFTAILRLGWIVE